MKIKLILIILLLFVLFLNFFSLEKFSKIDRLNYAKDLYINELDKQIREEERGKIDYNGKNESILNSTDIDSHTGDMYSLKKNKILLSLYYNSNNANSYYYYDNKKNSVNKYIADKANELRNKYFESFNKAEKNLYDGPEPDENMIKECLYNDDYKNFEYIEQEINTFYKFVQNEMNSRVDNYQEGKTWNLIQDEYFSNVNSYLHNKMCIVEEVDCEDNMGKCNDKKSIIIRLKDDIYENKIDDKEDDNEQIECYFQKYLKGNIMDIITFNTCISSERDFITSQNINFDFDKVKLNLLEHVKLNLLEHATKISAYKDGSLLSVSSDVNVGSESGLSVKQESTFLNKDKLALRTHHGEVSLFGTEKGLKQKGGVDVGLKPNVNYSQSALGVETGITNFGYSGIDAKLFGLEVGTSSLFNKKDKYVKPPTKECPTLPQDYIAYIHDLQKNIITQNDIANDFMVLKNKINIPPIYLLNRLFESKYKIIEEVESKSFPRSDNFITKLPQVVLTFQKPTIIKNDNNVPTIKFDILEFKYDGIYSMNHKDNPVAVNNLLKFIQEKVDENLEIKEDIDGGKLGDNVIIKKKYHIDNFHTDKKDPSSEDYTKYFDEIPKGTSKYPLYINYKMWKCKHCPMFVKDFS